ncbi:MAG: hypothetical protein AAGI23_06135 [Bacteroidota bacterium]
MEFDTVGIYTIEIAGRSQGHAIDQFVLHHSDIPTGSATNINRPESPRFNPVSTTKIIRQPLNIYPTVGNEMVTLELPTHQAIQLGRNYYCSSCQRLVHTSYSDQK